MYKINIDGEEVVCFFLFFVFFFVFVFVINEITRINNHLFTFKEKSDDDDEAPNRHLWK